MSAKVAFCCIYYGFLCVTATLCRVTSTPCYRCAVSLPGHVTVVPCHCHATLPLCRVTATSRRVIAISAALSGYSKGIVAANSGVGSKNGKHSATDDFPISAGDKVRLRCNGVNPDEHPIRKEFLEEFRKKKGAERVKKATQVSQINVSDGGSIEKNRAAYLIEAGTDCFHHTYRKTLGVYRLSST